MVTDPGLAPRAVERSAAPTGLRTRAPAERRQLPDEVATYVREQILSGALKPGDFLRMEPIAEALGVSITPVREGLVRLSGEGFVTPLPRRGFRVAEITREDVRDIFWAQGQLAGELAARAAVRITAAELEALTRIHEECNAALSRGDIAEAGRLRQGFHRAINLAARSGRLQRLLLTAVRQLPAPYYLTLEERAGAARSAHAQILAAIAEGDPQRARELTEQHRQRAAVTVIALLEERGFWPAVDG